MKTWIALICTAVTLVLLSESATARGVVVNRDEPGPTPFISFVHLTIDDPVHLSYIKFQVRPRLGSATRPISARYSSAYLQRRGYLNLTTGEATVPVFGLYSRYNNTVSLTSGFTNGSSQQSLVNVVTAPFDGGTYSNPTIIQSRLPRTNLSYDYILLRNYATPNTPIIIDSDGQVRWVGTANIGTTSAILFDNAIYLAGNAGPNLYRMEFDGHVQFVANYSSLGVTNFHHNIDYGKNGLLLDVDSTGWLECQNMEVDAAGTVLKTWNFATIISDAMIAGGDDPTQFVYPRPNDWFHNNATTYRRSDNSFIVSSRENFVISVNYDTGAIKWILGDPTKRWFQFPSLRSFALTLGPNTLPPIGQHALSVPRTTLGSNTLLLFDNGRNSIFQMPPGNNRDYSAPRKYLINQQNHVATEVWHYLANPLIYSPFCSSVYEDAPNNYLIDYTLGGPFLFAEIVGLDSAGRKAFDYMYEELDSGCGTAYNSAPIHLENLLFD